MVADPVEFSLYSRAEPVLSVDMPVINILHSVVLEQLLESGEPAAVRNRRIMEYLSACTKIRW